MSLRKVGILFFIFFPMSIFAKPTRFYSWNQQSSEILNHATMEFSDSFAATAWGGCNTRAEDINSDEVEDSEIEVTKGLAGGPLKLRSLIYKDSGSKRRNLIIQFAGIFGSTDETSVNAIAHKLSRAGNNVIVVPNPLSEEFVEARAKNVEPGNLMEEGRFVYKMLVKVINENFFIKKVKISNIDLFGVSYGAFLASVINGIDSAKQQMFRRITLLSPPINMREALANVDNSLDDINHLYSMSPLTRYATEIYKICKSDSDRNFSRDLFDVSKVMTLHLVMQRHLINTVKQYNENFDGDLIPQADGTIFSSSYRRWKRNLRFRELLENYLPRTRVFTESEMAYIGYHFELSRANRGFNNVKILSTSNDFLNFGLEWPVGFSYAGDSNYKVIPYGGHLGYMAMSWFDKLMYASQE